MSLPEIPATYETLEMAEGNSQPVVVRRRMDWPEGLEGAQRAKEAKGTVGTVDAEGAEAGRILVRVAYSGLNYKDALALSPGGGRVVKQFPIVPGIDLTGTVVRSSDPALPPGTPMIATGYALGVAQDGGFADYVALPSSWAVPLPPGLTLREAAALGTAGLTAALSIHRLEAHGLKQGDGPVLVTGATGGVGSLAVAMLARRGFAVTASTGKADAHDWLRALGADAIATREEVAPPGLRPLASQRWAAAVDCVGGKTLAAVLASLRYGGAVAASGLTGGADLPATVHPFILRGVSLLGVDSVECPMPLRRELWERMATDWKPAQLETLIASEVPLADVPARAAAMLQGESRGRVLVVLNGSGEPR